MEEKHAISEARKRANKKWNDENQKKKYDRIQIVVPKGRKADIEAFANGQSMSVNGWICGLLREAIGMNEKEWKQMSDEPGEA